MIPPRKSPGSNTVAASGAGSLPASPNVTAILDGVNANEDRSLAYDARDRPISATAPNIYGEEIYDYDTLDNVRRVEPALLRMLDKRV